MKFSTKIISLDHIYEYEQFWKILHFYIFTLQKNLWNSLATVCNFLHINIDTEKKWQWKFVDVVKNQQTFHVIFTQF